MDYVSEHCIVGGQGCTMKHMPLKMNTRKDSVRLEKKEKEERERFSYI